MKRSKPYLEVLILCNLVYIKKFHTFSAKMSLKTKIYKFFNTHSSSAANAVDLKHFLNFTRLGKFSYVIIMLQHKPICRHTYVWISMSSFRNRSTSRDADFSHCQSSRLLPALSPSTRTKWLSWFCSMPVYKDTTEVKIGTVNSSL